MSIMIRQNCNKEVDTDLDEFIFDEMLCEECFDFAEEWGDNTWLMDK